MKTNLIYLCSNCDAQSPKWSGRCLECGGWGTLTQGTKQEKEEKRTKNAPGKTEQLASIATGSTLRLKIGLSELDQVLGGGLVPGSLILMGGEPGIGKSTLLLQIALALLDKTDKPILYCSGEESGEQVRMRFDRMKKDEQADSSKILFAGDTETDTLCATIIEHMPALAIIDSIQTVGTKEVPSEPGSVAQVRACTVKFLEVAKQYAIPIIITGHVTKEGMVAGPKTLEHLVDTVLYMEGDANGQLRLVKTVKNRFGSTNEMGVFEMTSTGLEEVKNPSAIFIGGQVDHSPGTVTAAIIEGSRCFLVHVQALTTKTFFGYPQRRCVGFDPNRLQLLIAVLSKRVGLHLGDQDIHVNVVGGLKIQEPALDLAICASIMSAFKGKPLDAKTVFFGEIGLSGEVRPVSGIEKRLKEAEKLGFQSVVLPNQKTPQTKLLLQKIQNLKELEI